MSPFYFIKKFSNSLSEEVKAIAEDYFEGEITVNMVYFSLFEYINSGFIKSKLSIDQIKLIAKVVEDTLASGDDVFKEAVVVSFLEELTNSKFKGLYELIKPFLGIESVSEIKKINNFWNSASQSNLDNQK